MKSPVRIAVVLVPGLLFAANYMLAAPGQRQARNW